RGNLLGEQHRMAHRQHQDPGRDLHLAGERRRVSERVERLEPGVAVEPRGGEQVIDHPHVDAVLLALLDRRADALHVLRIAFAAAPRVGRDPCAEFYLGHWDVSASSSWAWYVKPSRQGEERST